MTKLSNENIAIFPLSISHYHETLKQSDSARRKRLAQVMRLLSQGFTVASLANVVRYEIRSALISMLHLENEKEELRYIGKGLEHTLGNNFNFSLIFPAEELTDNNIRESFKNDIFNMLEDIFLSGSSAGVENLFEKQDLTPDNLFKDHLERWKGCSSKIKPAELRRIIYSITFKDILNLICTELINLNVSEENFFALGEEGVFKLLDLMPTRKVDMHLREQWAKNSALTPKQSDLNDWANIGPAICYSDFVVTENQMASLLSRSQEYKQKVTADLTEILRLKVV
jgi:hypothetical protein